jgi:hypothetical protein
MIDTPEMPPHVLANYRLALELEAAFLRPQRSPRYWRAHSSVARRHFNSPESREAFWGEYYAAMKEPSQTPSPARELTYDDVIASWGGGPLGQSQISGRSFGRSADNGVRGQA